MAWRSAGPSSRGIEVWSATGADPLSAWENGKAMRRVFDGSLRAYVAELPAALGGTQRPSLNVSLPHPVLVMHVYVPAGAVLSFALSVSDATGSRRRLAFSSAFSEERATPLHVQVPLPLPRSEWVHIALCAASLVQRAFGSPLRSIDNITLATVPKLRRIYALTETPSERSSLDEESEGGGPASPSSRAAPPGDRFPRSLVLLGASSPASPSQKTATARSRAPAPASSPSTTPRRPSSVAFGRRLPTAPAGGGSTRARAHSIDTTCPSPKTERGASPPSAPLHSPPLLRAFSPPVSVPRRGTSAPAAAFAALSPSEERSRRARGGTPSAAALASPDSGGPAHPWPPSAAAESRSRSGGGHSPPLSHSPPQAHSPMRPPLSLGRPPHSPSSLSQSQRYAAFDEDDAHSWPLKVAAAASLSPPRPSPPRQESGAKPAGRPRPLLLPTSPSSSPTELSPEVSPRWTPPQPPPPQRPLDVAPAGWVPPAHLREATAAATAALPPRKPEPEPMPMAGFSRPGLDGGAAAAKEEPLADAPVPGRGSLRYLEVEDDAVLFDDDPDAAEPEAWLC